MGFLTTRIETLRNVEVTLPNAYLVGNVTRNFSRLAANGGMRLTTSVTIGYDTPWRQVQAMLQMAAERTAGVLQDTPPRVLQTALQDFYVEYTLVVGVRRSTPEGRRCSTNCTRTSRTSSTSTACRSCRPTTRPTLQTKKFVPKEQWFPAPARVADAVAPAPGRTSPEAS